MQAPWVSTFCANRKSNCQCSLCVYWPKKQDNLRYIKQPLFHTFCLWFTLTSPASAVYEARSHPLCHVTYLDCFSNSQELGYCFKRSKHETNFATQWLKWLNTLVLWFMSLNTMQKHANKSRCLLSYSCGNTVLSFILRSLAWTTEELSWILMACCVTLNGILYSILSPLLVCETLAIQTASLCPCGHKTLLWIYK